jgi:hypothetical protein
MAEVLIELKVMDLFTPEDYEELKKRIRRYGAQRLYFQGDGIRVVRDKSISSHVKELFINKYTSKSLPPYVLLLKDIENAIENYEAKLKKDHSSSGQGVRAMG